MSIDELHFEKLILGDEPDKYELIEAMIRKNPELLNQYRIYDQPLVVYALEGTYGSEFEFYDLLTKLGADMYEPDDIGQCGLQLLIRHSIHRPFYERLEDFLRSDRFIARKRFQRREHPTALCLASQVSLDTCKLVFSKGEFVADKDDSGDTALFYAIDTLDSLTDDKEMPDIVEFLMDRWVGEGLDVEMRKISEYLRRYGYVEPEVIEIIIGLFDQRLKSDGKK